MKKQPFTAIRVAKFECGPGKSQSIYWDSTTPGLGLRVTANGARSYIFESRLFGRTIRITIGDPKTYRLDEAKEEAIAHKKNINDGIDPRDVSAQKRATKEARERLAEFSLARLCDEYCAYLESLGRGSHRDARSIFKLHVKEAWPKEAKQPAKEITSEQIADMMRKLHENHKGRTSNKLRSYLHAAYEVAKDARSQASIPIIFKSFDIKHNTVTETSPDATQNKPDKHPLSEEEMRVYWCIVRDTPGFQAAALRLHLLTGAQRIAQFVRLLTIDAKGDEMTILDGKGRPGQPPRRHTLPLIKAAADALALCNPEGKYALSEVVPEIRTRA